MNTLVCAVIAGLISGVSAHAETTHTTEARSVFADKGLGEVLNKDVLALPTGERQAWLHGVVVGLSIGYAKSDKAVSRCLTDWAFDVGDGLEVLPAYMKHYPDEPAYSVVYAVAKKACPGL